MSITFRQATAPEAKIVAALVMALTEEIGTRMQADPFGLDLDETIQRCKEWMANDLYSAILGWSDERPIAVATFTETHALYAGGRVGIIQEFYVVPEIRSSRVGTALLAAVREHGRTRHWSCIELCTPPLPEFERTLQFYRTNGLDPVGGRKMRQKL
ncbi:GNAT family N-acetyltransferase [Synechococcus sp. CCY 9618]|uniref:GNAT family N-acetyltransferase n=1 Tax=Synechococcus sp. CCY 9618 TaxID=2815602 RepID=UPI001C2204A3|nr:GNAT family N-acetyltransferase [Synechococcus sp. CCY 9618]